MFMKLLDRHWIESRRMVEKQARVAARLRRLFAFGLFAGAVGCAQYGADQGYLGALATLSVSGSSPVESITQVPTTVITGSPTNVAISAVDLSRSFVLCSQTAGSSRPNNIVTCKLSATNQVTIETSDPNNQNVALSVVQFSSGASVQRGSTTLGAADGFVDITISSVNLAQTFVLVTSRMNSTDTTIDQQRTVAPLLPAATTLRLFRGATGTAVDIEWQVIQLSGASVQSGVATMNNGTASVVVSPLAFDANKTFVIAYVYADAAVLGRENSLYVRGVVTSSNTVEFYRDQSTGTANVAYFLVSMTDATTVQRGSVDFSAAYTNTPPLSGSLSAVDTNRSVVLARATIVQPGTPTSTSDQDSGQIRAALSSTTAIEIERGSGENPRTGTINWQVVQFQ